MIERRVTPETLDAMRESAGGKRLAFLPWQEPGADFWTLRAVADGDDGCRVLGWQLAWSAERTAMQKHADDLNWRQGLSPGTAQHIIGASMRGVGNNRGQN